MCKCKSENMTFPRQGSSSLYVETAVDVTQQMRNCTQQMRAQTQGQWRSHLAIFWANN